MPLIITILILWTKLFKRPAEKKKREKKRMEKKRGREEEEKKCKCDEQHRGLLGSGQAK